MGFNRLVAMSVRMMCIAKNNAEITGENFRTTPKQVEAVHQ